MPTSVARFGNEAKTPRGGVFVEVKSSAQGNEGEGSYETSENNRQGGFPLAELRRAQRRGPDAH